MLYSTLSGPPQQTATRLDNSFAKNPRESPPPHLVDFGGRCARQHTGIHNRVREFGEGEVGAGASDGSEDEEGHGRKHRGGHCLLEGVVLHCPPAAVAYRNMAVIILLLTFTALL